MMQIEYPFPILLSHDQLFKKIQFPIHKARTTYVVLEYVYHTEIGSLQHGYILFRGFQIDDCIFKSGLNCGFEVPNTENSILLILFKIPFIVTYVDILFLTSEGMEAERGPKLFSEGQKPFSEGKESMKK